MSIKDKALEQQLLASMARLEELNDRVGPTPLRHRINEMVINARIALREFDQDEYEADENWTAPPARIINPGTALREFDQIKNEMEEDRTAQPIWFSSPFAAPGTVASAAVSGTPGFAGSGASRDHTTAAASVIPTADPEIVAQAGAYCNEPPDTQDRVAWALCQIIDDNAPIGWTRYRFAAKCIASNKELMADLLALGEQKGTTP